MGILEVFLILMAMKGCRAPTMVTQAKVLKPFFNLYMTHKIMRYCCTNKQCIILRHVYTCSCFSCRSSIKTLFFKSKCSIRTCDAFLTSLQWNCRKNGCNTQDVRALKQYIRKMWKLKAGMCPVPIDQKDKRNAQ